ncbi:MAG: pentapeptide repeat-containing protein [Nitrososphaeraceae archaeon]
MILDLSNTDLSGADLSHANLSGTMFLLIYLINYLSEVKEYNRSKESNKIR